MAAGMVVCLLALGQSQWGLWIHAGSWLCIGGSFPSLGVLLTCGARVYNYDNVCYFLSLLSWGLVVIPVELSPVRQSWGLVLLKSCGSPYLTLVCITQPHGYSEDVSGKCPARLSVIFSFSLGSFWELLGFFLYHMRAENPGLWEGILGDIKPPIDPNRNFTVSSTSLRELQPQIISLKTGDEDIFVS
jgi:hypothetical protein